MVAVGYSMAWVQHCIGALIGTSLHGSCMLQYCMGALIGTVLHGCCKQLAIAHVHLHKDGQYFIEDGTHFL